ncbi:hypothetical protein MASR1M107_07280 [Ignavibacteriales bacterium]
MINKDGKLSIEKSTGKLEIPVLAVHGEIDLTVPVKDSERIISYSKNKNPDSSLLFLKQDTHLIWCTRP